MSRNSGSSHNGGARGSSHGPGHGPSGGVKGAADASVEFTFNADQSSVTAMSVTHGTRSRELDITGDTFKTTLAADVAGAMVVVAVERTDVGSKATHTQVFTDADKDGDFDLALSIGVLSAASDRIPTHAFTFGADGSVTGDVVTRGDWSRTESIDDNESYVRVTVGDQTYVVKTTQMRDDDYRFEISRDDNGDGQWTTVAHGHVDAEAAATYVDANGDLTLAGLIDYLNAADAVIG
jgi:hypothetical protein